MVVVGTQEWVELHCRNHLQVNNVIVNLTVGKELVGFCSIPYKDFIITLARKADMGRGVDKEEGLRGIHRFLLFPCQKFKKG